MKEIELFARSCDGCVRRKYINNLDYLRSNLPFGTKCDYCFFWTNANAIRKNFKAGKPRKPLTMFGEP